MKLVTFLYKGKEIPGVLNGDRVIPLDNLGVEAGSLLEFVELGGMDIIKDLEKVLEGENDGYDLKEGKLLAPIPRPSQDVICLGVNYMDHAWESARFKKEEFSGERPFAVYFSKRVNEAPGPDAKIAAYESLTEKLDYEAELCVVIGKDCKNVKAKDAFNYVFGYTVLNDLSARDVQNRHKQFYFGKSFDGFTPMGPCIVTEGELGRAPVKRVWSKVNGELRQDSTTDKLIFDIPFVIEELSKGMTLRAGTLISTGTPAGVGMGFDPPKFLKPGDVVEVGVEGIGILKNYIVSEKEIK